MSEFARPTLSALILAAVESTGATAGWILERRVDDLIIVAAAGGSVAWAQSIIGRAAPVGSGTASLVAQTGQPVAIQPGAGSLSDDLSTELLGRTPTSLICVPCIDNEHVVGALQLVDKLSGDAFDFDDVETATMLGAVAGVALGEGGTVTIDPPSPDRLGRDLVRLSQIDPPRYAALALVVEALLA